jgi:SAM-dependent methyltransferase
VAGADIDRAAIERARQMIPDGEFQAGDMADLSFLPEQFDIIRLDNTLEHVAFPSELLRRARRWLKRTGSLMVYVPHGRSGSIRLFGEYAVNVWPPFHLQLFSRVGLRLVLAESGYDSVRCWGYTPRGIFSSSFVQWWKREGRIGAAAAGTPPARLIEASVWPLLALARHEEELIGVGHASS